MIVPHRTYDETGALVSEMMVEVPNPEPTVDTDALRARIRAATSTAGLRSALLDVLDVIDTQSTS